jgi:predicted permease
VIAALAGAFLQIILPVVLVASCGYALGRRRLTDIAPVTALAVTVLVPGVVFDSLARAALPWDVLARLALHVVLQLIVLGALASLAARVLGWGGEGRGALLLSTLFPNAGNVGLPLSLFAFGAPGLAIAGGWFALASVASSTLGVFIAARARAGAMLALRRLPRLPIIWAVVAGIAVNVMRWPLPAPLAKTSQLLAHGSLAVLLLLLGLQLSRLRVREEAAGAALATALRLFAAPPIAWLLGRLVGLHGLPLAVAVVEASMPTAVTSALWAMEFDARPKLVAAAVVLSTLVGIVTLTVLTAVLAGTH